MRSPFGETSEAMYLTQGFTYDSAEAAEARFNGDDPGLCLFALRQPDR
jgi:O-succinylhomoserine sulfhydrylase